MVKTAPLSYQLNHAMCLLSYITDMFQTRFEFSINVIDSMVNSKVNF